MRSSVSESPSESTRGSARSPRRRSHWIVVLAAVLVGSLLGLAPGAVAREAPTQLCDTDLRYGDSGDCVLRLQERLNELGLNCGNELEVDGAFGPATRMRIYAFQGRNQLAVDGSVGPETRAALADPDEGLGVACAEEVENVIREVWPDDAEDRAIEVARCESTLNPIAVGGPNSNGTLDYGVFQFNGGGTLQEYLAGANDAEKIDAALHLRDNVEAALRLYEARGWQPWTCAYSFAERYDQLERAFDTRLGVR